MSYHTEGHGHFSVSDHRRLLTIAIVAMVSAAAYANTLGHGFVYDDAMQILQNPWIKDVKYLPQLFSKSVWGFHSGGVSNYYRPFMNLIFMGAYQLFGLQAWGFHLVNVIFHAANSLLVLFLFERLLPSRRPGLSVAFVAALLFSVHPIHSEVVAWACGITDASYTFFLLVSWLLYLASGSNPRTWSYLGSLAAFFCSLLCKEPAVVLPAILVASDYAFDRSGVKFSVRIIRYIPYGVVVCVYLLLRYLSLGGLFAAMPQRDPGPFVLLMNGMVLFMRYVVKLVLPIGLSAYHPLNPVSSIAEPRSIAAVLVTLAFVGIGLISFKKHRAIFLALVLTILPLLPVLHMPSLGTSALAERYLYLPSVGFVLLVALSIDWLRANLGRGRAVAGCLVVGLAAVYLVMTVTRNSAWKDNFTLYSDMAAKYPSDEFSLNNYADALWGAGRREEAIAVYRSIVTKANPYSNSAFYNLGSSLQSMGRFDEAIDAYKKSLALEPNSYFAHYALFNVGTSSLNLGRLDEAVKYLTAAVRIRPGDPSYHGMLGDAFGRRGQYEDAIREFEAALRLAPDETSFRVNLDKARSLKARNER